MAFNLTSVLIVITACATAGAAAEHAGPGAAGVIDEDTTWAGEVYLAGDLYIAPEATLTVEPGTRVTVSREDALSRGILIHGDSRRVEVEVEGTLVLNGTPEGPVVFVPEADGSPDDTWSGLKLKKEGVLNAEYVWLVGVRRRLPSAAALSDGVYTVEETRKSASAYLPYSGRDRTGKRICFYPDGTFISEEAIKANGGNARWGIALCFTGVGAGIAYHVALGLGLSETADRPSTAASLSPVAIPVAFFAAGYLIGRAVEYDWGVRRAQNKWLKEHPAFTPPF